MGSSVLGGCVNPPVRRIIRQRRSKPQARGVAKMLVKVAGEQREAVCGFLDPVANSPYDAATVACRFSKVGL